ncbi:MAG: phytanoyl-CoA dioxygenase family protein [Gammaproteobacteria bacterium]|nr:MAG: phytanoyl-CoA dioxygenase family protein [Gammaproteobacteria bacterium]
MLTPEELKQYRTDGYLIRDILPADVVAAYRTRAEEALRSREGARMLNLQFLQPGKEVHGIQPIVASSAIRAVIADLLGGGRQGWHRDLMQIPDAQIDPAWFTPEHLHNYVQVNLPLLDDACLWIVPGSHSRPFDAEERAIFGSSPKMAALDAGELRAGRQIVLRAGQAAFYNNHAVHRGYGGMLAQPRMTIHLGFHSTARPPTPHFAVLDRHEYTPAYLAGLSADVRRALQQHLDERAKYPQLDVYHDYHQQFIRQEFSTR